MPKERSIVLMNLGRHQGRDQDAAEPAKTGPQLKTTKSKRPTRAQMTHRKRRTCPGCHVRRSPRWWPNPVSPVCLVCSWRVW
jgi:hypothetical protein